MHLLTLLACAEGLLVQNSAWPPMYLPNILPVREHPPQPHGGLSQKFSKDDAGKAANGLHCALGLDWTMDSQLLMGGASFVQQNIAFADAAFANLKVKDQLVLVDGNLASVRYFFQGTANRDFAGLLPTRNKIEPQQ